MKIRRRGSGRNWRATNRISTMDIGAIMEKEIFGEKKEGGKKEAEIMRIRAETAGNRSNNTTGIVSGWRAGRGEKLPRDEKRMRNEGRTTAIAIKTNEKRACLEEASFIACFWREIRSSEARISSAPDFPFS